MMKWAAIHPTPLERVQELKRRLSAEVCFLLERHYDLEMNTVEKITRDFFGEGALPNYYFFSNTPEEMADHIFIITQLLNANTESIKQESRDGKVLSYFVNVGRDFPGKLARIIEENLDIDIFSFDSVKTRSGIRILSLERRGRAKFHTTPEESSLIEKIKREVLLTNNPYARKFIDSLPANYFKEEISIIRQKPRIARHLQFYANAMETDGVCVVVDEAEPDSDALDRGIPEHRVASMVRNPDRYFPLHVLKVFERHGVNLNRSYYDTFEDPDKKERVGLLSLYIQGKYDLETVAAEVRKISVAQPTASELSSAQLERSLVEILHALSSPDVSDNQALVHLTTLRSLIQKNTDLSTDEELDNLLLNAVTDFYKAAEFMDLADHFELMRLLLRFETLSEFYVPSQHGDKKSNLPGFRFAHSTARGAGKGGLRLDPIVRFDEVSALAFMMTWKTAKSKILFGGAKGGLIISPKAFRDRRLDFIDTLTNFGRSLFLVTGPMRDVPAGDVGCGPEEIGILFEGFKSALRDLALMAYGMKKGVTSVGNKVLSLQDARAILEENFDIDCNDREILRELINTERYLELVAAAQITGKPRMGIAARDGATGRGILYSVLAAVTRLYLDGEWEPAAALTEKEKDILRTIPEIDERELIRRGDDDLITDAAWKALEKTIYPKLLKDKTVIVQGTGKVGASALRQFQPFGVNIVAVADVGGAVVGDHLDVTDLLKAMAQSADRSIITAEKNVRERIPGAREGGAVLTMPCDILLPCALENVITARVATDLQARIVACGGNGTNTSKAEEILQTRGKTVVYDFLCNGGGVVASYFEWLRNITDRSMYEAEVIKKTRFDINGMDPYIMPEFRNRIKRILAKPESPATTREWNLLLRDVQFAAVNDDYSFARRHDLSLKRAGFVHAIARVLTAEMVKMDSDRHFRIWKGLSDKTKNILKPYFTHPEVALFSGQREDYERIIYG